MATSLDGVTGTRFPSLCASVKYLENYQKYMKRSLLDIGQQTV